MLVRASDILYTMPKIQTKVTEATGDKTECVKNERGKKTENERPRETRPKSMRDSDPDIKITVNNILKNR